MIDLSGYSQLFLEEIDELLTVMERAILAMEQEQGAMDAVRELFRAAHTIKGSAAAMGYTRIAELTHEMESVLDRMRQGEIKVTSELADLLLACLDELKACKQALIAGAGEGERATSDKLVQALRQCLPLTADNERVGKFLYVITVTLLERSEMKLARAYLIFNEISRLGMIVNTSPPLTERAEHCTDWTFTLESDKADVAVKVEGLLDMLLDVVAFRCTAAGGQQGFQQNQDQAAVAVVDAAVADIAVADIAVANAAVAVAPPVEEVRQVAQTIRVDVERLEFMMNLVGELMIDQTRMRQLATRLTGLSGREELVKEITPVSDRLTRLTGQLLDGLMHMRMLPLEQLFNRMPRLVRDLSRQLGKEVRMQIEGGDTELDRTVIDAVSDPLIHLIRNAIDHGIEAPAVRERRGKQAEGLLKLSAAYVDHQVVIRISDDGQGIDVERIKEKAVASGLITVEQAGRLGEKEAIALIFNPGFSTATQVTDVSGRGVGMDIVKSHVEKLNGRITIETEAGRGTQYDIFLPLTLSMIKGLQVQIHEASYLIPLSDVQEIARYATSELRTLNGGEAIHYRSQVIPVIWLSDYLNSCRPEKLPAQLSLVIVGPEEQRHALVVDRLLGNQEVVVKSLGAYTGKQEGVFGTTILGDGQIALILETAGLLKSINRHRHAFAFV